MTEFLTVVLCAILISNGTACVAQMFKDKDKYWYYGPLSLFFYFCAVKFIIMVARN